MAPLMAWAAAAQHVGGPPGGGPASDAGEAPEPVPEVRKARIVG